ncbi:MAG: ATP-grasp domain-containing protein [Lachnospiraceae bacterium]|nr:ATP-grasp domain-containing protein [Lachnospiraceae bacterium]
MKKIFILGASALQIPMIQKAKENGLYVYALDYNPSAVGIPFADEFLCISTIDREAVLAAAKKYKPDFIMTSTSDMPVRTAAWVNEKLGLKRDLEYEDAICATDKDRMRRRMQECKVPVPKFYAAYSMEDFIGKSRIFRERFVAKPADNAASRGVVLVDTLNNRSVGFLKNIYNYVHGFSRSGVVMVEEYMEGPEVSVEIFTIDGEPHIITITDKMVTNLPYFVETGHTEPSVLPDIELKDIRRVAIAAVKAIRMQNGPCHAEIKVTPKGAKLVEIAARMGGDFITSKLVPMSTGVDMTGCCMDSVIGNEVNCTPVCDKGSAIRFMYLGSGQAVPGINSEIATDVRKKYRISSIEGEDIAGSMPGVTEVELYVKPGDEVGILTNSNGRFGHVIAGGKDAKEAAANAEDALRVIKFEFERLENE